MDVSPIHASAVGRQELIHPSRSARFTSSSVLPLVFGTIWSDVSYLDRRGDSEHMPSLVVAQRFEPTSDHGFYPGVGNQVSAQTDLDAPMINPHIDRSGSH